MFSDILSSSNNTVLVNRLNRVISNLQGVSYSTEEEYQLAIYTAINNIFNLDNKMTTLTEIAGGTPALVGDVSSNFTKLNNDAVDIIDKLQSMEIDVARLFNLAEASQNSTRQQIREILYLNTVKSFTEPFINTTNLSQINSSIDFLPGRLTLPISNKTQLEPTLSIGIDSSGSSTSDITELTSAGVTSLYTWEGSKLSLQLNLSVATPVNRIVLSLDDYSSMQIVKLVASSNGTDSVDILQSLGVKFIEIDPTSNKYSGSLTIDFPPVIASTLTMTIQDLTGSQLINLRGIELWQLSYSNNGYITSNSIPFTAGSVSFSKDDLYNESLTTITYLVSTDGVNYYVINEGNINLTNPFWYKVVLARNDNAFNNTSVLVSDPSASPNYSIISSSSIDLGSNIFQRTISLTNISGPIQLKETPITNTLILQVGNTSLSTSQYSFINNTITLTSNQSSLLISYQVSTANGSNLSLLKSYFTPFVNQISFEAIS